MLEPLIRAFDDIKTFGIWKAHFKCRCTMSHQEDKARAATVFCYFSLHEMYSE
jgi:hypothetical protein